MSVTVRLAKVGKKNAPAYKIVVSNTRDKRNGRFLDVLGYYNPFQTKKTTDLNKKKLEEWKNKGAIISPTVEQISEGKYTFEKYSPNGRKGEAQETKPEAAEQAEEVVEPAQE